MRTYGSKLIILRGNSGCGKSTVAKRLREASMHKTAIIEQDYVRRIVLKEKEAAGNDNAELIRRMGMFALSRDFDVIVEGILSFERYGAMLTKLVKACPDNHVYYFDVSLEETLRRHQTKPNANEFGEEAMRQWYKPLDLTHFPGETIIPEQSSLNDTVQQILQEAGL